MSSRDRLDIAKREYDIQRHMTERGFPVARPLLIEESSKLLGGPFLVMEKVAGPTLYERLVHCPWLTWFGARDMAVLHYKLHSLPVADFPGSRTPLLKRRLGEIAEAIELYKLHGLSAAHAWLVSNRPAGSIGYTEVNFGVVK